jgi:hypothetical protein
MVKVLGQMAPGQKNRDRKLESQCLAVVIWIWRGKILWNVFLLIYSSGHKNGFRHIAYQMPAYFEYD